MAKTKNAQASKKPSRGSASASPITPPVPPAPVTGVPVFASPIASSTPGFGDHDESHSSDHTFSKSSSSNGAPNVDKAIVTLPTVSSRTRSKVSTPQKPKVVLPKIISKGKKVAISSSKAKNLKEYPPFVSSSDSEPEKGTEEDHGSEGLSDSSEKFVPKDQPSVDDSASESEEPEADPVTTEPVAIPAAIAKKDKGKRPIVSPSPVLPQKRKRPSVPEKPPQGKTAQRKARSASPGITNDPVAASASTSAPTEMAEFNLRLGRMESSQALLLRKMESIMKYF
ncbi:hypothetical protein CsatA_008035 [Cannabis sativa]